jgi:hypothetical protein
MLSSSLHVQTTLMSVVDAQHIYITHSLISRSTFVLH